MMYTMILLSIRSSINTEFDKQQIVYHGTTYTIHKVGKIVFV